MKLGGTLSIDDGLRYAVVNARALAYNCMQFSIGMSGNWQTRSIDEAHVLEFKKLSFGMDTYVHLPYTINTGEGDARKKGIYKGIFRRNMRSAAALGAKGAVLHVGYKKELSRQEALRNSLKFIEESFEETWGVRLYLETDAGSKNESAYGDVAALKELITLIGSQRVNMCLDTAHMYARGMDVWQKDILDSLLDDAGNLIKLVHLNIPDPNVKLGSSLDRHNTAFLDRDWDSKYLIEQLVSRYPCILERRSLTIQKKDGDYIRKLMSEKECTPGLGKSIDNQSGNQETKGVDYGYDDSGAAEGEIGGDEDQVRALFTQSELARLPFEGETQAITWPVPEAIPDSLFSFTDGDGAVEARGSSVEDDPGS